MKKYLQLPSLDRIAQCRILVVGDVMLDRYWFGAVDRVSPEAPVPVVHVNQAQDRLGGAANVARNIAALGAKVSLLGIVGRDEAAVSMSQLAKQAHIDRHWIEDDQAPTTMKMRVLGRQQQLIRVDFEAPPASVTQLQLFETFEKLIDAYDVVVFSDYAKGVLADVARMIELARQRSCLVLVDPKGQDYVRYKGARVLTPNRSEMSQVIGAWTSESDLSDKAQALRVQLELDAILVTRSEEGMSLFSAQGASHVPALAREVFDVSGAGDTVIACLAVMQALGKDLEESMYWANLAGSVVVAKLGTSTVSYDELCHAAK